MFADGVNPYGWCDFRECVLRSCWGRDFVCNAFCGHVIIKLERTKYALLGVNSVDSVGIFC